jgi:inward rectifier potassium channel
MAQPVQPEFRTFGGAPNQLEVIGLPTSVVRDVYHFLLNRPWWVTISAIGALFFSVNTVFAVAYWIVGGVAHAAPDSFRDAFFFSVQTLGTIGYGAMYPQSTTANVLVAFESLAGIIVAALATGIAFAKFARSDARIMFTKEVVICPIDGEPHLMFRVANQRGHLVTSAKVHVTLIREHRTREGIQLYQMLDLTPIRDHHIAFTRSWSVMHRIAPGSPLYGASPEDLSAWDAEIVVGIEGMDVAAGQPVTAQHSYLPSEIVWGARHADIWMDLPGGRARLDFTFFHTIVPTAATPEFPYSNGRRATA